MGASSRSQNYSATAGIELRRLTSKLILSIIPTRRIYYWHFEGDDLVDPREKLILLTDKKIELNSEISLKKLEAQRKFILNHHQQLKQGEFFTTNLQGKYKKLEARNINNLKKKYDWLFLPACYQNRYIGGIFLHWLSSQWKMSQYNFLEAVMENYGCQYFGQKSRILSPETNNGNQKHQQMTLNLSHIHHEFKTPLTGILGFSKMLRDELYGTLNKKQHQYVQSILNSAEHLLSLVNNFLDLSKIDANCEELFYELVMVKELCLSVISMLQPMAKEQGLSLNLEVEDGIDVCYLDQQRWKQILINLLSNAIKFTEKGSVTLEVKCRGEELIFSVIDTGIGIKIEDQTELFQPFKQISHSLNLAEKGTGLGLALSLKLAQLHGGDIQLTSTPGQGSCFAAILPLKKSL